MTHTEWANRISLSVPCAAWHITFGGKCFNCGWGPEEEVGAPTILTGEPEPREAVGARRGGRRQTGHVRSG